MHPGPLIFGILNMTEDSFSDGGRFLDPAAAKAQAKRLIEAGADALDIGQPQATRRRKRLRPKPRWRG